MRMSEIWKKLLQDLQKWKLDGMESKFVGYITTKGNESSKPNCLYSKMMKQMNDGEKYGETNIKYLMKNKS